MELANIEHCVPLDYALICFCKARFWDNEKRAGFHTWYLDRQESTWQLLHSDKSDVKHIPPEKFMLMGGLVYLKSFQDFLMLKTMEDDTRAIGICLGTQLTALPFFLDLLGIYADEYEGFI
jgi:hypothetical protein